MLATKMVWNLNFELAKMCLFLNITMKFWSYGIQFCHEIVSVMIGIVLNGLQLKHKEVKLAYHDLCRDGHEINTNKYAHALKKSHLTQRPSMVMKRNWGKIHAPSSSQSLDREKKRFIKRDSFAKHHLEIDHISTLLYVCAFFFC